MLGETTYVTDDTCGDEIGQACDVYADDEKSSLQRMLQACRDEHCVSRTNTYNKDTLWPPYTYTVCTYVHRYEVLCTLHIHMYTPARTSQARESTTTLQLQPGLCVWLRLRPELSAWLWLQPGLRVWLRLWPELVVWLQLQPGLSVWLQLRPGLFALLLLRLGAGDSPAIGSLLLPYL